MDVIPAIDLLSGRCVRLYQGDYARSQVFNDNPADVAKQWVEQGASWLHIVDLDGAKMGRLVNQPAIEAIVQAVPVPIQVGGGLRDPCVATSPDFFRDGGGFVDHADAHPAVHRAPPLAYPLAVFFRRHLAAGDHQGINLHDHGPAAEGDSGEILQNAPCKLCRRQGWQLRNGRVKV